MSSRVKISWTTDMRRCSIALLTVFLMIPRPAQCWWETGHETIARLAVAYLTPAALFRVSQILNVANTPDAVADALAAASIWADQVKGETKTGSWHYVDLALQDRKENLSERCEQDNCVTAQIRLFAAQVASQVASKEDDAQSRWSKLEALRFLTHFVGDIHQPLHAVSDADLGGNCELLNPAVGQAKNLHALWDGGLVNALGLDDRALAADLERQTASMSVNRRRELTSGNADDWAWESHKIAVSSVYKKLKIPKEPVEFPTSCSAAPQAITSLRLQISPAYITANKSLVRIQLIKGALRLAKLLNDSV